MAFSADDIRKLEGLLAYALSSDNTARAAAEAEVETLWNSRTDGLVAALIQLLRTSTVLETRSLIAIILRRRLPNSEPVLFDTLAEELQTHVKKELLAGILAESSPYVRGLICDTVAELAEVLLHKDEWPELLPFAFSLSTSDNEALRLNGVEMFGRLAEKCTDYLQPHLEKVHALIGRTLTADPSLPVRAQGVISCCKTVVHSDDSKALSAFQPFLPELLKVLEAVLNAKQFNVAKKMLSAMVDMCTEESKFLRPFLVPWANAMRAIGTTTALDDGIRQFAMETLIGIVEGAPGMCRKSEAFVVAAVQLGMSMMLEVEDDDDWVKSPDTPEIYDNSNFDHGEVSIDRLAVAIGPKICSVILPVLSDFVSRSASPDDWRFRHAGLRGLSQAGEAVPMKDLPIKLICSFANDPHPRVRYAACHALGQLSVDFAPKLQEQHSAIVLPALMKCLGEFEYPRVQNFAGAAMFNFIEKSPPECFAPYCEPVVVALLAVLKDGLNPIKAQVMTTFAAVAGSAAEEFPKYYDSIVPMIKHVIINAHGKENANLRSRAMESVTFIGMQCKEKFVPDARELMGVFIEMMRSGHIAPDDTSHQYMLQACARICTAIGKDFAPCLPHILPAIFEEANKKEDWSTVKLEGGDAEETPMQIRMTNKGLTSSLEDKATACSMLCSFCHDLQEAYFPYVARTAALMIPFMSYMLHDDVRSYACACVPDLFASAVLAMKAGMPDATPEFARSLFEEIMKKMLVCLKEEPDAEIILTLVCSFKAMVEHAGPALAQELLDEKALQTVGMAMLNVLTASYTRIKNRLDSKDEDEDFDEETLVRIEELNDMENELNLNVSECIGALVQSHGVHFLSTWEMLLPEMLRMLDPKSSPETRRIAIFIFDDLVEYLGVAAAKYFPAFLPLMIRYVADENVEVRQAAAYGLGMCAQHGGEAFRPYAEASCKAMLDMIGQDDSKSDDNASPTDNMISAVGRIAMYQGQPALLPLWLQLLPLTTDQQEAVWVYGTLCTLVEQNNTHLLGADFRNLPKVVSVFCDVLGTNMMDEAVEPRVMEVLQKTRGLPAEVMSALVAMLTPKQRDVFERVLRGEKILHPEAEAEDDE